MPGATGPGPGFWLNTSPLLTEQFEPVVTWPTTRPRPVIVFCAVVSSKPNRFGSVG